MKILTAVLVSLIVLGAHCQAHAKDPPLLSLTMEHFRDAATITDEPRDSMATISTEKGFVQHTGPMRMVWNDEYLRGSIDKKTGQKVFRVDAWMTYTGKWRFYRTASFQTQGGPRSVAAAQIAKEAANCAVGDCTYTEHVAFPVDEELLRQLAARRVPGKAEIWPFKLSADSGPDYRAGVSDAEIAGLLAKVDDYTNALPAVRASTAGAALKLDLGVGGISVAATAEHPKRAGILIIAVTSGSVAHRSGIIVGDILHDFDGHPIRTLPELEAAVAACAADSVVSVKLYRGTTDMALSAQF